MSPSKTNGCLLLTIVILYLPNCWNLHSQSPNDDEIREYFSSVVLLSEKKAPLQQKIDGKTYEIKLLDLWTKETVEKTSSCLGTGFFVYRGVDIYLVTAEHVATCINLNSTIKYKGLDGKKMVFKLSHFVKPLKSNSNALNWIRHPKADIAVLHLGNDFEFWEKNKIRPISFNHLDEELVAPNRFNDLTIYGFPLGLGETYDSISPITKNVRPASDIIYLNRFDNSIGNPFLLMDDASVGGFSGGPVIEFRTTPNTTKILGKKMGLAPTIIGLVHGNQMGQNGLDGFAAVVPAKQIRETILLAPKYSGKYTYYYPNGKLWSEVIFKDGLQWTVISNFDKNGIPQEKGTLLDGNGTLYLWDEGGEIAEVRSFENGELKLFGVFNIKDYKKLLPQNGKSN